MLIRSARARDMLGGMLMVSDMPVAGGRQDLARAPRPTPRRLSGQPCGTFLGFPPPSRSDLTKLCTQTRRDRAEMADNSPGTDWYDW